MNESTEMIANSWDLFNGKIGIVVDEDDDMDDIVIDGNRYDLGEECCLINEFPFDPKQLTLFRTTAYRGEGCYSGVVRKNNELYWLDIVSEGTVSRLIKLP